MLVPDLLAFPSPDLFVPMCLTNAKRTLAVGSANSVFFSSEGKAEVDMARGP